MMIGFDGKKHKKQTKIARLHEHYQGIIKILQKRNEELERVAKTLAQGSPMPDLFRDISDDSEADQAASGGVSSSEDQKRSSGDGEAAEKAVSVYPWIEPANPKVTEA